MEPANPQLAAIFQEMADVTEILGGDRFRVNSFAKVARLLGDMTEDVAEIGPDEKKLMALDGIGKGTAGRIVQFLRTGKIQDHVDLLAKVPEGLLVLLEIPGLGPKTVALLWKQGGVESLDDLKTKLEGDELAQLPGLGAKKLQNLRDAIAFTAASGDRIRIGQAMPLAKWFVDQMRGLKGVEHAEYAGSLRRGQETIGDIDIIVAADAKRAKAISDAFASLQPVEQVLAKGRTKTSVRVRLDGEHSVQVDLRVVEPGSYGAAMMYFTGSKQHNVTMRQRALKAGMTLNEYRLAKDDQLVAADTEQNVFKAMGLAWIPPELREDRGEIALAEKGKLPQLVTIDDIAAELHTHTTASDGHWSIRELAIACAERGFHTVAVTDHSKGQIQANGLSAQRLEAQIAEVRKVAAELAGTITILAGSEVDILADGRLDYPNSLLKELDVVVAAPHAALSQEPAKATARLLKAIEHPYVHILSHPTGRLINRRPGLSPDIKALCKAAAEHHVAMEVNANHYRLDLRDTHIRVALDAGAKISINTDAHGPADLDELRYGVLTARRAGATKKDVVNCLSQAAMAKWLRQSRQR